MSIETNIGNYSILLRQVKQRVALAQQRAIFAANEELLRMYWDSRLVKPITQPSVAQLHKDSDNLHNNTFLEPRFLK